MAIDVRGLAPLLEIFDMPTSISFYRDALGFNVVSTSRTGTDFSWARLSLNGVEIMLNTAYEAAERPLHPTQRDSRHTATQRFISDARTWMPRTNICGRRALKRRNRRPHRTECASSIYWIPMATGYACNGRHRTRCAPNEKNATVRAWCRQRLRSQAGARATTNFPTSNPRTVRATQFS